MAIGRVENDLAELTLKRPDPTVTGMIGSVTAVAFLVERPADRQQERKPKSGIWIDFYLTGPDGRSLRGSDETKPEDGSATVVIPGLQPGGYLIEARVRNYDFSVVDRFTVTATQRLKPAKVEVTFFGHRGKQQLHISVTTEEGLIIPSAVVTVIAGNNVVSHDTSKPYQMDFSESSQAVEVRAGNTNDLVWQGRLLGLSPGFPGQLTHSAI